MHEGAGLAPDIMSVIGLEESIMRKLLLGCLLVVILSCTSGFAQGGGQGFPRVVGKWNFLKQTTDIAPAVLYTPPTGGVYRVTFVEELTIANGKGNADWVGGVSWMNALGQNPAQGIDINTFNPFSGSTVLNIRVAGKTPLVFSVSSSGDTSGAQYNIYVILEELEPL
jgi:hypothetical protein